MSSKRIKTSYLGVYYRDVNRIGGKGVERVYYITFKRDGKMIEEKVGRQYADVMTPAKAARIRAERIEGKRASRKELREAEQARKAAEEGRWTIARLWAAYLTNNPDLRGVVADTNRFDKHLLPEFGDKEPHDILPLDVDRLRLRLLKEKTPATVRNVLELLRRIVNFGERKRLCHGLSFKITMPSVNNLKTEDLDPDQLARLFEAIEGSPYIQAANIMKLALFTGLRRGEMFKLKWVDIDFERAFIRLRDPKGGPDQTVPMSDGARQVLDTCPRTDSDHVFPGRNGKQRTTINRHANAIKEAAGLPKDFRPLHGLRHTYASMLASSGQVDMYTLQKLLTHKSAAMTQRYAHLRDDTLKRASQVADNIISAAANTNGSAAKVVNIKGKNSGK